MNIGASLKPRIYQNKMEMERSFYNIYQSDATAIYMGHGKPIFRQNTLIKCTKMQYKQYKGCISMNASHQHCEIEKNKK